MNKRLIYIVGIVAISTVIFLVVGGVLIFLFFTFLNPAEESLSRKSFRVLTQDLDPSSTSKNIKFGFAQINRELPENEYISYHNEETGKYIVLSNFGGNEYSCTGSCSCGDESNRRSSATILASGMTLILSAFSTAVALKIARDTFEDNCVHKFAESCDAGDIDTNVEDCEVKDHEFPDWDKGWTSRFMCEGFCIDVDLEDSFSQDLQKHGYNPTELLEEHQFICENLDYEGEVLINNNEGAGMNIGELGAFAANRFAWENLDPFCKTESTVEVEYKKDMIDRASEDAENEVELCRGYPYTYYHGEIHQTGIQKLDHVICIYKDQV